ncbi:MAG: nuclear transport factor 2 family protein [Saprospiraceae bacterium]|nr:nuclear transport factor 2 family protein [Saprospiraceae bacterium]
MKKLLFIAALFCLAGSGLQAQSVNDELELQAFTRRFMAAYNAQDHAAIGKMYTDDAVRIDQDGKQINGAENIANYFAEQFRKNNATLLLKHIGINWSDAEHAWVVRGNYEVYGKTNVYDIPINLTGSYANAMLKKDGEWKIAKQWLTPPDMSKIKDEIQALNTAWANAANAKDAATILDLYADDAISMPDGAPALVGKAAIQKDIEADFASSKNRKTVTYKTAEVFGDENRVTETGTVVAKDATGKVAFTEKYIQIWEKRKGRWQVIREIYNHDSKTW